MRFLSFSLFLLVAFTGLSLANNLNGYAWSGNIGWVSFNTASVDNDTNDLYGYAWSENIGWIRLDPIGPYPSSPNHSAHINSDKKITGWARACAGAANANCSGGT